MVVTATRFEPGRLFLLRPIPQDIIEETYLFKARSEGLGRGGRSRTSNLTEGLE